MNKGMKQIIRKYLAFTITLIMIIQMIDFSGFTAWAATVSNDVSTATGDMVYNITDASDDYVFNGTNSDTSITVGIVVDVGAGNDVTITFDNLTMKRPSSGNAGATPILSVVSGNVNLVLNGSNSLICGQDTSIGACVSIASGSTITCTGSGTLVLHGTSNYWGGGDAVQDGAFVVDGPTVYVRGGNKIANDYGKTFNGTDVTVISGKIVAQQGGVNNEIAAPIDVANLSVEADGSIEAESVHATASLSNYGKITAGTIVVDLDFDNHGTMEGVVNTSAIFNNYGTISGMVVNSGTFTNESIITGNVENEGTAVNKGTITQDVDNGSSGVFTNNKEIAGNVTNEGQFELTTSDTTIDTAVVKGVITNTGTLISTGIGTGEEYFLDGNSYKDYPCSIGGIQFDGGTAYITKTKIENIILNGATVDSFRIGDATVLKVAGASSSMKVTDTMYIKELEIGDIQASSNSNVEIYLYDTYKNNYSDYATALVNGYATMRVENDTKLLNKFIVTCNGKVYQGSTDTLDTIPNIFIEEITYDIGEGVTVDNRLTTHHYSEDFSFTLTAMPGYYLPADYNDGIIIKAEATPFSAYEDTSIKLVSPYQEYTVSHTIDDSSVDTYSNARTGIHITVPSAMKKTIPDAPNVEGELYYITGTTTAMEYADSPNADKWTSCDDSKTEVASGTWYVRYKETYKSVQSEATEVYVQKDYKISIVNPEGSGLVWSKASGAENQNILEENKLVSITYEVADGYYLPEGYSMEGSNGITITRNGYDSITITGIPTADTKIELKPASSKYMALVVPEDVYTISAKQGENGYFTSLVTITAKDGYLVSKTSRGAYTKSITFDNTSEGEDIYFMDTEIGLTSPAVHIAGFSIDADAPVVSIKDGEIFIGDEQSATIDDDNLVSVTVNGEEVELVDGKVTLLLIADGAEMEYEIVAVDIAGNKTVIYYTVAASWTLKGIIPGNIQVRLRPQMKYTLDAGSWTIPGDATSYNGGNSFYVTQEGKYIFSNSSSGF